MNITRDHLIKFCEVISFMKIRQELSREIRCIRWNVVSICAVGMLILGMLTGALGSGAVVYRYLCLPAFALPAAAFILIWSLWYILLGGVLGIIFGAYGCCRSPEIKSGFFWMSLLILSNLIWYPVFFGLGSFVFSFLVLVLHILITFVALGTFARLGCLPSIVTAVYFVWLIYCLFVNFCIILLN